MALIAPGVRMGKQEAGGAEIFSCGNKCAHSEKVRTGVYQGQFATPESVLEKGITFL